MPRAQSAFAAQYIRMSTEHQDFSLESQRAANAAYASSHGLTILRTFTDAGISGLTIEKRSGLKALIAEVLGGQADFTTVLVHDVSRWGRFQNPDEAAHYEFICAEAGVHVAYCAEPFDNDGSPASGLLKHIKRAMAAEYSRDLSAKVKQAQRGLQAKGFWMGGRLPYGLRREVLDPDGVASPSPSSDVWTKRQGVHCRLVHGPAFEIDTVGRIFKDYLRPKATITSVARRLNTLGTLNARGADWSAGSVTRVLTNPLYVGRMVGGRRTRQVGQTWSVPTPEADWIVTANFLPPVISEALFQAVQRKRGRVARWVTDAEALADMKRIERLYGEVTLGLLEQHGRWSAGLYTRRFGAIDNLRHRMRDDKAPSAEGQFREHSGRWMCRGSYAQAEFLDGLRIVLRKYNALSTALIDATPGVPDSSTYRKHFGNIAAAYAAVGWIPAGRQKASLARRASTAK